MSIDSYSLVEHFDYICKSIPQPFGISNESVKCIEETLDHEYIIKTNNNKEYSLSHSSIKKLVDALGIKIKLLSCVADESNVIHLIMPALNQLFKCYADCFVFYADKDDPFCIIDVNVNNERGDEGTKYEFGPSPWRIKISDNPTSFTCFTCFRTLYDIDSSSDGDSILVKADEIYKGSQVTMSLFKNVEGAAFQPLLTFNSKFSNMSGFINVHPALIDLATGITITFPMNYASNEVSFKELWKKAMHLLNTTDQNDFIFREINELQNSNDTPNSIKNFIQQLMMDSLINLNQPIRQILDDSALQMNNMKPAKRKAFAKNIGNLIAYSLVAKHACCEHCGHLEIH